MAKNIILCMDGTGNEFGKNVTNVVETYILAKKTKSQEVYYDPGVGTGGYHYDDATGKLRAAYDNATGTGVHKNVEQAYLYLMEKYQTGDKVFIFGFSRGAFSARSLAGMLYRIGLLPNEHDNQLEYASKYYLDKKYHNIVDDYRENFCRPCPVHFIGVWDTVDATILTEGAKFTDTNLNPKVKYAYQAISIDERRKDFPITLWNEAALVPGQTMEQVWFAGVHSDVGGWYDSRDLSSISLGWMMSKAKAAGMKVRSDRLSAVISQQKPDGVIHESYDKFWKFRGSRTREIPPDSLIHSSVITRMEAISKYTPKLPAHYKVVD